MCSPHLRVSSAPQLRFFPLVDSWVKASLPRYAKTCLELLPPYLPKPRGLTSGDTSTSLLEKELKQQVWANSQAEGWQQHSLRCPRHLPTTARLTLSWHTTTDLSSSTCQSLADPKPQPSSQEASEGADSRNRANFIHSQFVLSAWSQGIRMKHAAAVSVWSRPARSHCWAESWSTWGLVQESAKSWMSPKIASSDARDAAARAGNLRHCSSDSWVLCLDVPLRNSKTRWILLHVPKYPTGWGRGTTSSNTSRVKEFLSSINVYLNPHTCKYTCRWSY